LVETIVAETDERNRDGDADSRERMIWIPGGTFRMGSDKHYPEKAPEP
jgi:formylglycine-generating enzyme required for sulfatase activity